MSTVYKYIAAETDIDVEETHQFVPTVAPQQDKLDDHNMAHKLKLMLEQFANEVLKGDKEDGTRAYQILRILTDPQASREMCGACQLCDADAFDKDTCLNYSMSIGKFLGINKSLVSAKISRIRVALARWLGDQSTSEAQAFSQLIPIKFKV